MKIRIVQFSDIHAKSKNETLLFNAKRVISTVRTIGDADAYIIVASGDLAFSGKKEEYEIVSKFMKTFFSDEGFKRTRQYIDFLYVPGNHDIDFLGGKIPKDSNDFKERYAYSIRSNKLDIEFISAEYHEAMEDFFEFARLGNCEWTDYTICKKTIVVGEFKLAFTLLNSAAFSLLGGDGEDKGCHRLTDGHLEMIRDTPSADFNCLIMHHGIEWYTNETKKALRDILSEKYDVLLIGHEHDEVTENRIINDGEPCYYIQSNAFNDSTLKENGFCVVDIDSKTKYVEVFSFVLNNDIYVHSKVGSTTIKRSSVNGIRNNEEFNAFLTLDQNGIPYERYYYFPTLEYQFFEDDDNNHTMYTIRTEAELMNFLVDKRNVFISGDHKAGKSLLAKRIYQNMLENEVVPILFNADIHNMKKDRIIEYAFNQQYLPRNNSFERFLQLPQEKRVAIIDDAELIKEKSFNPLMEFLSKEFGSIIVFHESELPIDLHKQVLDAIDKKHKLLIHPFWYSSRKGLISNILSMKNNKLKEVELKTTQINDLINKQISFFYLNPEFIINFVNLYEQNTNSRITSGKMAFSMVYENTIMEKIYKICQPDSPNKFFIILQEIAYHMHFGKKKSISVSELNEHVETYNKEYRQNISFLRFIEISTKSGIINERDNQYSFRERTHLAYFVARAINQKTMDPFDAEYLDAEKNFYSLLDALCFGINSDIVLFLSVVTNNMRFINIIIQKAGEFFSDKEEFSFLTDNALFINNTRLHVKDGLPGIEERKERDELISRSEREMKKSDVIEAVNEYDYSDKEIALYSNQILLASKYLEIISKTLAAFCVSMKSNQQDKLVELIYRCPNVYIYMILKKILDDPDKFIEEVYQKASQKNKSVKKISRDYIRFITEQISAGLVVSTYLDIASTSTSDETIHALNAFKKINESSNYSILNLMFNARQYDIKKLARDSIALDKKCTLPLEHSMITLTVREFFMRNDVQLHGEGMKVADYFFGSDSRKVMQVSKAKKRLMTEE